MARFLVNHIGGGGRDGSGSGSGWTTIDGDDWTCVDYPGVGASLAITVGGITVAAFAPGKWSAIRKAPEDGPPVQPSPLLPPSRPSPTAPG